MTVPALVARAWAAAADLGFERSCRDDDGVCSTCSLVGEASSGSPRSGREPASGRRGSRVRCRRECWCSVRRSTRAWRRRRPSSSRTTRTSTCSRATGAWRSRRTRRGDSEHGVGVVLRSAADDEQEVERSATIVMDDFSADWNGPDARRERWFEHPRVVAVELGTGAGALAIVAVVRR